MYACASPLPPSVPAPVHNYGALIAKPVFQSSRERRGFSFHPHGKVPFLWIRRTILNSSLLLIAEFWVVIDSFQLLRRAALHFKDHK